MVLAKTIGGVFAALLLLGIPTVLLALFGACIVGSCPPGIAWPRLAGAGLLPACLPELGSKRLGQAIAFFPGVQVGGQIFVCLLYDPEQILPLLGKELSLADHPVRMGLHGTFSIRTLDAGTLKIFEEFPGNV